jgi:RNA polymerase sigma-70 factor (ECF subfamily)
VHLLLAPATAGSRAPEGLDNGLSSHDEALAWGHHRGELYQFVRRRVGDPDATEDIVQDVLLRALAHRGSLREPARMRAWLFQIARNAVADYFRSRSQAVGERSGSHGGIEPTGWAIEAEPTALAVEAEVLGDETAVSEAERRLAESCIRRFVADLPHGYQQAVTLADLEQRKQRDVAAALGLSLSGA